MKRRVNILSVLLVTIILSSFVLINITAEKTPSTDLTQEEQDVLDAIQNISDAGTNFITDVSKSAWPELKDTIKSPQEIPGKLYNWTTSKLFFITGTTDSEGKDIWLWYYFFGMDMWGSLGIIVLILSTSFILAKRKNNDEINLNILKPWLIRLTIEFLIASTALSILSKSPFAKDFAFLLVVLGIIFLLATGKYLKDLLDENNPTNLLGPEIDDLIAKWPYVLSFSVLYLLFQSIPLLNVGLYFITLEFLGYNNPLFTWAIRPLIIAFLLFFSKDIIDYFARKYAKDKKFKDALEKKAIEEMNKASLRA